jgi:hypothetical protein
MNHFSYACPVCNGFSTLFLNCNDCGASLKDYGRFSDLLAPYSPYRPIDDLKMSDGWIDVATHSCPHYLYCPRCGLSQVEMVAEMPL